MDKGLMAKEQWDKLGFKEAEKEKQKDSETQIK